MNEKNIIYLDYQATTPLRPEVLKAMMPYFKEKYGNPHSNNHSLGKDANLAVEKAKKNIASLINCDPEEIILTSGATESNNFAIKSIAESYGKEKIQIITLNTEHKCVIESCNFLEKRGYLVHYLEVLEVDLCTKRYDQIEPSDFFNLAAIVLSPGPGLPSEKQGLSEILTRNVGKLPILGVCLGMQALVEHMGGSLENQQQVKHGVQETILLRSHQGLFSKLPQQIEVGLYHSWRVVCPNAWITASSQSGVPMAIERPEMMVYGVQFHPESIMTPEGKAILRNFMEIVRHN